MTTLLDDANVCAAEVRSQCNLLNDVAWTLLDFFHRVGALDIIRSQLNGFTEPSVKSCPSQHELTKGILELATDIRRVGHASHDFASPTLGFIWALLPPWLDKPVHIAAMAATAKRPCQLLHEAGRLRVGHMNLHPNSLRHRDADICDQQAASDADRCESAGEFMNKFATAKLSELGCLNKLSLSSLVGIQIHLPRLTEAFWLLDAICHADCRSLRKIVDRQSRWRPRVVKFERLDQEQRMCAAGLADSIGGTSLPSLRHCEGTVFSVLLRARGEVAPSVSQNHRSLADRLDTLHLVDAQPADLRGLWQPEYPQLKKLVLLNLPATSPGETVHAIVDLLPRLSSLAELQLDFQFFDPAVWDFTALEALVVRLQTPPCTVHKLVLEWCRLGDHGVRSVCRALAEGCLLGRGGALTELSLAHSDLKDATDVCDMLEVPSLSLTKLDLSSNSLDDTQAAKLANSLRFSKVSELRLRDSQISVPMPMKTEWFWGC